MSILKPTDEEKLKFVNDGCEFTNCKNRTQCIEHGYICPAACQLKHKMIEQKSD